ncbi:hypothetical protein Lepto7376_0003 [[Leptolyngbya] sp. PCC 7376]|uniref:nitrate/nitrite transporter NrtS n=1 Tax=[Leptolyngbya] sp. PCC 7376 TaxID=111781 RepID=UPI00029F127D|nr:nitrate/nitrite transporter NrtS [[Leptolyngbya] sp. PCC 7376]AFY36467.1 hypothetical protein Lepto7376_0003 [[Leptolyngbya] sp. PCC 7376]
MKAFLQGLRDPDMMPSALRVALLVGTILFSINHGNALLKGKMDKSRWLSSLLTYAVPYCVNIHGQVSSKRKFQRKLAEKNIRSEEQIAALTHV